MSNTKHCAIEMKCVTKEYGGVEVLSKVDIKVQKGSIHGFLGPNGAGKSTSIKMIAGIIPPTQGHIFVLGKDVWKNPQWVKGRVGFLPETPPLYGNMSVEDYLSFVQELHGKEKAPCPKQRKRVISRCGLQEVHKRLIANLSRGFKQRVGIAQALVYEPEIIILDEPMVALDPNAILEIRELILELKKSHTILLSTHRLAEVSKLCDDITIIHKGQILKSGPLDRVQKSFQEKRMIKARVLRWSSQEAKELKSKMGARVQALEEKGVISLQIAFRGADQIKVEMSEFLSRRAGLLEFKEESVELEEIFKEVVR